MESEDKFRNIFDNVSDGLIYLDKTGKILDVNKKAVQLFGGLKKELLGNHFTKIGIFSPKDIPKLLRNFKSILSRKRPHITLWIKNKKGQKMYLECSANLDKRKGRFVGIIVIVRDITERKQAEEKIKASLIEKEVLLQEVHHRVKNNMQIISSLIKLQSRHIKDEQMLGLFRSIQNRIQSIAAIHERLYLSKNFARVNFDEYVQRLADYLFSVYGMSQRTVRLNKNIKDVSLDINTAIPCGLIINELISNSLKHAFPDGQSGEIKIKMQSLTRNDVELTVSDNGVGLPKKFDLRKADSLGLYLVKILVESQLYGDITLDRTKGTSFHMRLRLKP